ncbi:hypothetical protein Salat_0653300 [Sesamum alatum]|uniref:Uncharacterized protein n=1 Tax=Sesamum alatum TaxID=300844 RepID=A0AAE1YRG4_9LAMI|nr:hypothetical protein Salat_0653300 [Sesamum alatum]
MTHRHSCCELRDIPVGDAKSCRNRKVRWKRKDGLVAGGDRKIKRDEHKGGRDAKASSANAESGHRRKDGSCENEYTKGSRPIHCLSLDFPLQTEDLIPSLEF